MKDIKKIEDDIDCMKDDCDKTAVSRIKTGDGAPLELCVRHEEEFAENLREKIEDKYEGMSEEEIAKKLIREGEGLL